MGGRGGSSAAAGIGRLDRLTTSLQVSKWMEKQKWFQPGSVVNLRGIALEAAKSIAQAYKEVFKKFPQLKGFFNGITVVDSYENFYAQCYLSSGKIEVNQRYYENVEKLAQNYARDIATGFHPPGTSWKDIVVHEIGHAIDGYISNQLQRSDWKYTDHYYNSQNLQEKISKKLGYSTDEATLATVISRYGASTPVEWLAESFAEGFSSASPRQNAKELISELGKLLRRIREQ